MASDDRVWCDALLFPADGRTCLAARCWRSLACNTCIWLLDDASLQLLRSLIDGDGDVGRSLLCSREREISTGGVDSWHSCPGARSSEGGLLESVVSAFWPSAAATILRWGG
jgi:hypothetical protein